MPVAPFPPAAVIFDLDGTLLDTIDDLADAMNAVLEASGYEPHPVDAYYRFIGDGMVNLVRRALPPGVSGDAAVVEKHAEVFRSRYSEQWNVKTRPYEGIPELLDSLEESGIPKGVCSNKPDALTKKCIAGILPDWHFGSVVGQSDALPRKPDPAIALHVAGQLGAVPSRTWFVGDSGVDMKTARAAGMFPVGVLWGFRSREELEDGGAAHVVATTADLANLFACR